MNKKTKGHLEGAYRVREIMLAGHPATLVADEVIKGLPPRPTDEVDAEDVVLGILSFVSEVRARGGKDVGLATPLLAELVPALDRTWLQTRSSRSTSGDGVSSSPS